MGQKLLFILKDLKHKGGFRITLGYNQMLKD